MCGGPWANRVYEYKGTGHIEPNDWGVEQCVHLRGDDNLWNDNKCDAKLPYICEYSEDVDLPSRETQTEQWRHVEWGVEIFTQDWFGTTAWCALRVKVHGTRKTADTVTIPGEIRNGHHYFDRNVKYTFTMVLKDIGVPTKIEYWLDDCIWYVSEGTSLAVRTIQIRRLGYSDSQPTEEAYRYLNETPDCKLEPTEKCETHCFGDDNGWTGDEHGWMWPDKGPYHTSRRNC